MARSGLDPRRFSLPRRRTVFRFALVAALLLLALGVLYAAPQPTTCAPGSTANPTLTGAAPAPAEPTTPSNLDLGLPPDGLPPPDGSPLPAVPAGLTGVSVRLADPAIVAVLRPGTRVDLLAEAAADTIAGAVVLAALPGAVFDEPGAAALFVAVPPATAAHVSNLPIGAEFRVIVPGS